jgi:hypothetical protein
MLSEKEKIELITQISLDLNGAKDIDLLLEKILTNVRRFFNADAGSIYLKAGDELKFSYAQNDTLQKRLKPGKKLPYVTSRPSTSPMYTTSTGVCLTPLTPISTNFPNTGPSQCSPFP